MFSAASLVSLAVDSPDEKIFYSKIAAPLREEEIKYMQAFGIDDGDGLLDVKEFVILTIIRIGNVPPALVLDIIERYKAVTANVEGSLIPYEMIKDFKTVSSSDDTSKRQVRQTLLRHHSTFQSSSSSAAASTASSAQKGHHNVLGPHRKLMISAHEAINKRKERRFTARNTLKQNQEIAGNNKLSTEVKKMTIADLSTVVVPFETTFDKSQEVVRKQEDISTAEENQCCENDKLVSSSVIHEPSKSCDDEKIFPVSIRDTLEFSVGDGNDKESYSEPVDEIRSALNIGNGFKEGRSSIETDTNDVDADESKRIRPMKQVASIISHSTYKELDQPKQRETFVSNIIRQPTLVIHSARKATINALKRSVTNKAQIRQSTLERMHKINAAHQEYVKRQRVLHRKISQTDDICIIISSLVMVTLRDPHVQALLAWLLWLSLAALFYCVKMELTFYRGFYMSVNVGYAIYWSQEESDAVEKAFSVLHIVVGQIMTSFALAAFAKGLTNSTKEWYSSEIARNNASRVWPSKSSDLAMPLSTKEEEDINPAASKDITGLVPVKAFAMPFLKNSIRKISAVYFQHKVHFFAILWLTFGIVWSVVSVGWSVIDGIYFSVTSLSTGGIWSIPKESSDYEYFIVAIFTCTGAPILCLSCGVFAHWISTLGESSHIRKTIEAPITIDEHHTMIRLDIDDGDGFIDQTEFIILVLIRMKAIRPELIAAIRARFHNLDTEGLGALPYKIFQLRNYIGEPCDT